MASVSDEVFADDFQKKKPVEKEPEPDLSTEFPKIPNTEPDPPTPPEKDNEGELPSDDSKGSRKKGIIGAIIIGLIVGGSLYGAQVMGLLGEPFDPAGCHYGVTSNFIDERCLTEQEYIEINDFEEAKDEPETTSPPQGGSGGTQDTSSASDKVELEKTKEVLGYYMVKSNDSWYGDYVDFRKVPSKIEESGDMKVSFRCHTDDFQGTSTYFATFRNVMQNNLQVDVYISDKLVDTKSTDTNKAIIVEGSCYGHE